MEQLTVKTIREIVQTFTLIARSLAVAVYGKEEYIQRRLAKLNKKL